MEIKRFSQSLKSTVCDLNEASRSVAICAFPEFSTVALAVAVKHNETKKMCCFCTNSDVIGTASQTVWTGGTAYNRCVRGKRVMGLSSAIQCSINVHLLWHGLKLISAYQKMTCNDTVLIFDLWFLRESPRYYITTPNAFLACVQNTQSGSQSEIQGVVFSVNGFINGAVLKCRRCSRWGYPTRVHARWSNSANSRHHRQEFLIQALKQTAG